MSTEGRCDCNDCQSHDAMFGWWKPGKLTKVQKYNAAVLLKNLERAYVQAGLVGDYSSELVRERRDALLRLLGIPEEMWKKT